ncbi:YqjF family protein [Cellulomonas hominis]|uniref:YqjF family protein n=1 Tax=Cellulomonas hominis TaxID=156981 RepID=UPI001BA32EC7|nr:DUF2071 domain-containing protein [Cellulomonas hominis]VTR75440.1 hypothetical protein CHMI_00185 [Cellulomonas hominis]
MSGRTADQPVRVPATLQRWDAVAFLHWPCEPAAVQRLLPPGLRADVLDGAAWLGITPLVMRDVRAPGTPAPPALAAFAEVNARTYVHHPASGTDGLWFLTMLCARTLVVTGLRALGLPYVRADGTVLRAGGRTDYAVTDRRGAELRVTVRHPGPERVPDAFTDAVTGRWNAYVRRAGRLWRVPVEHPPWPLHAGTVEGLRTNLPARCGLDVGTAEPLVHWSPGVDARIGLPRPV